MIIPPYINKTIVENFVKNALIEDVGNGDHTSLGSIPENAKSKVQLNVKSKGIMAGITLLQMMIDFIDKNLYLKVFKNDGSTIEVGNVALTLEGNTQKILSFERILLNTLQRMSGIATYTHKICQLVKHTNVKVLDTRKTTPNFRFAEKWAVSIGGGYNHRFGLYDMVLLKDNHIDFAGGIEKAILNTEKYFKKNNIDLKIEIEIRNLHELEQVLKIGKIQRIMLDNMSIDDIKKALSLINGKYETEISGGIDESNIVKYAETGVDFISLGALTHSAKSLDLSLKAI